MSELAQNAEFDVAAARRAGLPGYLVRTGKWRSGNARSAGLPDEIEFDTLAAVANSIIDDAWNL